jgi:hypothetical protein
MRAKKSSAGFARRPVTGIAGMAGAARRRAAALLLCLLPLAAALAPPARANDVAGDWRCVRTDTRGTVHQCVMRLSVDSENRIEGRIEWTLLRSPNLDDRAKLGLAGTERIRGRVTGPESLFFEGYAEDDPEGVVALDKYPMQLSPGGEWMFGRTESGGTWTAQFYATRE